MRYENARWLDADHSAIDCLFEGVKTSFPAQPGNRHYDDLVALNVTISDYVEPAPSSGAVNAERDRRMRVFTFDGVAYSFDPVSRDNISGAAVLALGAISAGAQPGNLRWANPEQDFGWIALDNTVVPMDAQTCWAFAQAAAAYKSALIFAARALKDFDPIPGDYTDNSYWPD